MEIKKFISHRMVKGEDLNHHGTLFAGRTAQWFVETGFIAAASLTHPKGTNNKLNTRVKLHDLRFNCQYISSPVQEASS